MTEQPRSSAMTGSCPASYPRGSAMATWTFTSKEFERTGFTGAVNRYRNVDRDWEDLAAYDGAVITQPSLFIGGALDASGAGIQNVIDSFSTTMPALVSSHLLPGCGHWVPEERPAHVNEILVDWLHKVHPATA